MMKKFLAGLLLTGCCLVYSQDVKVGFAVENVTPPANALNKGIQTHGWGGAKPSKKISDKVFVKALAMRDKNNTLLVILTADTVKFHPGDVYMLQDWFEKTFKTNHWHLIMNASHTHQAPTTYIHKKHSYAGPYHNIFIKAVKNIICQAVKKATTVMTIKFAKLKINKDMICNKYASLGKKFNLVDTDFPVFAFFNTKNKKIAGFLWSVAAHPTCVLSGGKRPPISANSPGAVARALHGIYGNDVVCIFAQGAAGDLKIRFPGIKGKIKRQYLREARTLKYTWLTGKRKGNEVSDAEAFDELNKYGMLYADIIKQGFKDNKFKEIANINLKIAGKEVKIPLALSPPPRRSISGTPCFNYYKRPEGTIESHKNTVNSKTSTEIEKYRAREALYLTYSNKRAAYTLFFGKVMFNEKLQIVTMSHEAACEIGLNTKEYYKRRGVETVFFAYCPTGAYYPSNLHHARGTYQGYQMHPDLPFDFNKFALDNIISLNPR